MESKGIWDALDGTTVCICGRMALRLASRGGQRLLSDLGIKGYGEIRRSDNDST